MQILLSRTQAGPGRKVKQEQEEISRNNVPRLFLGSVEGIATSSLSLSFSMLTVYPDSKAHLGGANQDNMLGLCCKTIFDVHFGTMKDANCENRCLPSLLCVDGKMMQLRSNRTEITMNHYDASLCKTERTTVNSWRRDNFFIANFFREERTIGGVQ